MKSPKACEAGWSSSGPRKSTMSWRERSRAGRSAAQQLKAPGQRALLRRQPPQSRNALDRRGVRIVERRMHAIRREGGGIVAVELYERRHQVACIGVLGGELVGRE